MGLTRTLAQGLVTVGHGQLFNQMHEVGEIEIGGLPAAQQHDLGGHRGGHVGIAVAVTAHPGDEGDRRRVQRQARAATVEQSLVQAPHELRHRPPQGILHHGEAPLGLVHRGGPLAAKIIAEPDLGDQFPQAQVQPRALALGQARQFQLRQAATYLRMLVDQGATGDLGGMGGEHQFDAQRPHGVNDLLRRHPLLDQLAQVAGQAARGGQQLIGLARDIVVLVGDIGEIQELAESPRHRYQLLAAQVQQQGLQLIARPGGALPRALGKAADLLDELQEFLSLGGGDGIAQHPAQQTDIAPQGGVIHFHPAQPGVRSQPADRAGRPPGRNNPTRCRTS